MGRRRWGSLVALSLAALAACSGGGSGESPRKGTGGSGGDGSIGLDGTTCFPGTTACNGVCVDLDTDPKNCGACASPCATAKVCSKGACADACGTGTTSCSGSCVDLGTDPKHCGSCDTACSGGKVCSSGACVTGCATGETSCAGACVDTQVDPENCGSCGQKCALGGCISGKCQCSDGVKSGDESDVDCGGSCAPCSSGKACGSAADCKNGLGCSAGICWNAPPLDSDLVGYWKLEGDGIDSSGNGNNGTVTAATAVTGKVGQAMQFASGSCIAGPDSASLELVGATALSVLAWIETTASCLPTDHGIILNKENTYELGIECSSGTLFQEAIQLSDGQWAWNGTGVVSASAWHHVAVVWDGATVHHYVDGAEAYTRPLAGAFAARNAGFGIGCRSVASDGSLASAGSWFIGAIDEVAVYRRALSSGEIAAYYSATK